MSSSISEKYWVDLSFQSGLEGDVGQQSKEITWQLSKMRGTGFTQRPNR
jgi:hypothetical protein